MLLIVWVDECVCVGVGRDVVVCFCPSVVHWWYCRIVFISVFLFLRNVIYLSVCFSVVPLPSDLSFCSCSTVSLLSICSLVKLFNECVCLVCWYIFLRCCSFTIVLYLSKYLSVFCFCPFISLNICL